jgi:hypothetical protein
MEEDPRTASLVIGGTGMLAAATRWLAQRSRVTILVARRASGFQIGGARLRPVDADWSQGSFPDEVTAALAEAGPIGTALLWLHQPEPVLAWLLPRLRGARIVLILGSRDGRPGLPDPVEALATVRLGSVAAAHGRRWLTHAEISAGAVAALQDGASRVVGELTPLP